MVMDTKIVQVKEALHSSEALLIGAGAGMGVDSGLPDFRGKEGFWKAYPPLAKLGIRFEEMANPKWFQDDPDLAWGFYGHRLHQYRNTKCSCFALNSFSANVIAYNPAALPYRVQKAGGDGAPVRGKKSIAADYPIAQSRIGS